MNIVKQSTKELDRVVKTAVKKLVAFKKKSGMYNVKVRYKGLDWTMVISTFDDKPFDKKTVRVEVLAKEGFFSKEVATLTPREAGYDEETVRCHARGC